MTFYIQNVNFSVTHSFVDTPVVQHKPVGFADIKFQAISVAPCDKTLDF